METLRHRYSLAYPEAFTIQNREGVFPAVCLVEHARNFIPADLNRLGVAEEHLRDHIAWDIGIEAVTRRVSDALGVPSIYCLYSRLVIDVNRPLDSPELMRAESDGIAVPGNAALTDEEKQARLEQIFHAYHNAADELIRDVRTRHKPAVIGMHSCTPCLKQGTPRPWHIGLSTYDSDDLMNRLAELLRRENLHVGIHEPYDMRGYFGTSLDRHGREKGLPQVLIEIRQDLIGDEGGSARWAGIMARVFGQLFKI
jgi:predicted N-formylglutamate amidohydrolase